MYNNEIINQIKDSLDIAEIISERVKLRKTGRGYVGLCPFHRENTPSFHVYEDTQHYYCFGCKAAGDIFTYIMRAEAVAFPDALRLLADRAGVKLPEYSREGTDTRAVLDLAAKFFTANLTGTQGIAARAYMSRRKLDDSDTARYSLGYSLNSWDSLTQYLRKQGITDRAILDAGLAIENKGSIYDRFRGRLMFPIHDVTGKVIAFGGRLIDGEGAKYINSPESTTYSKRRNLYLLDEARKVMLKRGRAILVEGYMDALRLHKCGFTEAVASLGTSLTPEQANMLSRYADKCYICYDSDEAGQSAAVKGMYILAENGLSVYVVSLPEGKDPDEFLSTNEPAKFTEALSSAKPLVMKHIELLSQSLSSEQHRRKALEQLFASLRRLSPDEVLRFKGSICDATMLPPEAVERYLLGGRARKASPRKTALPAQPKDADDTLEAAMCFLLWDSPECRTSITPSEAVSLLTTNLAREAALAILTENTDNLQAVWHNSGEEEKIGLLTRGEVFCSQLQSPSAGKFLKVYSGLKRRSIDRQIAEIQSLPPSDQDMEELQSLLTQRGKFSL